MPRCLRPTFCFQNEAPIVATGGICARPGRPRRRELGFRWCRTARLCGHLAESRRRVKEKNKRHAKIPQSSLRPRIPRATAAPRRIGSQSRERGDRLRLELSDGRSGEYWGGATASESPAASDGPDGSCRHDAVRDDRKCLLSPPAFYSLAEFERIELRPVRCVAPCAPSGPDARWSAVHEGTQAGWHVSFR